MFEIRFPSTCGRAAGMAIAAGVALVLLVTSCGSSSPEAAPTVATTDPTEIPTAAPEASTATAVPTPETAPTETPTAQPTTSPEPTATAKPTAEPLSVDDPVIQNSEVLQRLVTIVNWINTDPPDQPTYEASFAPEFLQQVSWDQWLVLDLQLSPAAPWTIGEARDTGLFAEARLIASDGSPVTATIAMNDDGLVDLLLFAPAADIEQPESLEETVATLENFGDVTWMVADPADCSTSLAGDGEDDLVPLGSVFKLYVLGAIVDAVEAGTVTWDQPVAIRDELDSLPSDTTQDLPAGTELTVRQLAERMISISDNTATDHLMDLVGRNVIEESLDDWGHSNPDATLPFMTTREMFILKLAQDENLQAWPSASVDERRQILADLQNARLPSLGAPEVAAWLAPISVADVEWFATPRDMCRVITQLRFDPEAARVLALASSSDGGDEVYAWAGFKGGSEPGVFALVTMFEVLESDVRRVVVVSVTNEDTAFGLDVAATADFVRVFAADVEG